MAAVAAGAAEAGAAAQGISQVRCSCAGEDRVRETISEGCSRPDPAASIGR